ncbi:hypothetical protein I4U23_031552 [Adineta vaga]|nr:hypothetical protein I4U23_031552 [Adineta vaga]
MKHQNPTKQLHPQLAPASYAQARIWLDEKVRFDPDNPQVAIYNMPFIYPYVTGQLSSHAAAAADDDDDDDDDTTTTTTLRYLDYAVIEQQMSMTGARLFWLDTLHHCQLHQPLALPYDRHRLSNEHRSGRGTSLTFDFDSHLSHQLLIYASTNQISLEHLILSFYFLFLFKITNGQHDLCIGTNVHGRYRPELNSIIGMFANAIPLRCQLDVHWSLTQLIHHNNTQLTPFSDAPLALSDQCIPHAFIERVMTHPQKVAVELDEQSLTYAELLHSVQMVSLHFVEEKCIVVGDIICQCVERNRLWTNNSFWLQHILGTSLYNYYLCSCGAKVHRDAHIYTTTIDAPWLLEIDCGTWIDKETILNCLHYNDNNTFELFQIKIGANCSIGSRSILFRKASLENNIIIQPMSTVTGFILSNTIIDGENSSLFPGFYVCNVGEIYSVGSWSYLNKLWFRQLIVTTFRYCWSLTTSFDPFYPIILRFLGAYVENDVQIGEIIPFLSYPANLLELYEGLATFDYILLIPTEITNQGEHRVDKIQFDSFTNLGNKCSILPGSHLKSYSIVGNLTRISRHTKTNSNDIFIGVPGQAMPFKMPIVSKEQGQIKNNPFWSIFLSDFITKYFLLLIYSSNGFIIGSILHTIIVLILYQFKLKIRQLILLNQIMYKCTRIHFDFLCSFLGNTQWLIRLFRVFGARIGKNVIIPEINSLFDYDFLTIGDNVRLQMNSAIVCHTFEQRIFKLSPVIVNDNCILMCGSIVMPGSKLMGNNRLYPLTLIMKNDQLSLNTHWKGIPAKSFITTISTQSVLANNDTIDHRIQSKITNKLSTRSEDLDDENNDSYLKRLYEQVISNLSLRNQHIIEINCDRGVGADWCVKTYKPYSYVGISFSLDFIELCRKLYSDISQLSFQFVDINNQHLPFENQSIDIIIWIDLNQNFFQEEKMKELTYEISRILHPNGYFLWCGSNKNKYLTIDNMMKNNQFIIKQKSYFTKSMLCETHTQNLSYSKDCVQSDKNDHNDETAEYCRIIFQKMDSQQYD